jgi:hypothetical protein
MGVIEIMLRERVDPNQPDESGHTPLLWAAMHNDARLMAIITPYAINNVDNITSLETEGREPWLSYFIAILNICHEDIFATLCDIMDRNGCNPGTFACLRRINRHPELSVQCKYSLIATSIIAALYEKKLESLNELELKTTLSITDTKVGKLLIQYWFKHGITKRYRNIIQSLCNDSPDHPGVQYLVQNVQIYLAPQEQRRYILGQGTQPYVSSILHKLGYLDSGLPQYIVEQQGAPFATSYPCFRAENFINHIATPDGRDEALRILFDTRRLSEEDYPDYLTCIGGFIKRIDSMIYGTDIHEKVKLFTNIASGKLIDVSTQNEVYSSNSWTNYVRKHIYGVGKSRTCTLL